MKETILYIFHKSKNDQYYFTVNSRGRDGSKRVLATSETYKNLEDAVGAVALIVNHTVGQQIETIGEDLKITDRAELFLKRAGIFYPGTVHIKD